MTKILSFFLFKNSPPTNTEESLDEGGPPISDNSISTTSRHADIEQWDVDEIVEEVCIFEMKYFSQHFTYKFTEYVAFTILI